jgi:peptidoglycan/LPS O-acetylase OafA/YrhL
MSQLKERLVEFDVLRVAALLLILYAHSVGYVLEIPFLEWFRVGGMYTGLGLFVFLSGYSLQYSVSSRAKQKQFNKIDFLKRRLIRIYPLYVIAIFAYIVSFHYLDIHHDWQYSPIPETLTLHLLSLQAIFYPNYPEINTLWFIGMIIPFYLFFAFSIQYKTRVFLTINITIFLGLLISRLLFDVIDLRLFIYFPLFVLGCLCGRTSILQSKLVNKGSSTLWIIILLALGLYCMYKYFAIPEVPKTEIQAFKQWVSFGLIFPYMLASITAMLAIATQYAYLFEKFKHLFAHLANWSYPAYLFHRVIYAGSYSWLEHFDLSAKVETVLFPVITVVLFLIAALITQWEGKLYKALSQKRSLQA